MKIIVGLGNPGREYADTPHNIGFAVIDELAGRLSCSIRRSFRFKARIGKGLLGGGPVLLVKPQAYMNLSGAAVGPIMRWHKVTPQDLVVVLDDADLESGRIRVRARGSSGGHKGLASVMEAVGSGDFARIRVGIGTQRGEGGLVRRVLTPFSPGERRRNARVIRLAADALVCVVESGVDDAMNRFNSRGTGAGEETEQEKQVRG